MSNVTKDFDIWTKDSSASTVLHSLPDAVFITDPQMRIFYFNLAAEKLTGFKSREALGMYCKDILKSGICETECAVKRALDADKNIFNIETTIVTATGQTIPSLISALLIKDATGKIFGYLYSFRDISVLKKVMSDLEISRAELTERNIELARTLENLARDITKRKQAEKMLGKKSEEQTLLLDNIQTLIWYLKDVETQGIVNKACADFFGKKKEDLENKKLHDIMSSKEEAEICIAGNKEIFEKKVTIHTEERAKNAKGERRLLAITKIPKIRENGNVEYVVCSAEDITERKQAAEAMQRAEQLKVAGDIAVGLAHELKNSLAGLEAAVEVLLAELVISDDHRSVLLRMSQEMRRVELLVKDLLNFARPARPQFTLVDVNSILNNATVFSLENLSLPPEKKGTIKIVKKYDADLPKTVADPMQLHQVFVNLLINSVDSMPDGGSLTVETSYEQTRKMIQVSISDTGAGIRREYLDKIFEPFFTTKSQGTGLGLPITKRLIEQNNGDITADNNPNGGAIFKVTLPSKRLEESDRYEI